ncbi:hypothetical protein AB0F45_29480, partial [Streptomyces achromogenes]|uniref:hypothetical protein n=1 Tax=Streptomyces achromogenes TaxID=67255 RepID=UPI0033C74352
SDDSSFVNATDFLVDGGLTGAYEVFYTVAVAAQRASGRDRKGVRRRTGAPPRGGAARSAGAGASAEVIGGVLHDGMTERRAARGGAAPPPYRIK